jgi:hypothetical protein
VKNPICWLMILAFSWRIQMSMEHLNMMSKFLGAK